MTIHEPRKPELRDGVVAILKADCPTCELIVPVLGERLHADSLILLDDADRPSEVEVLRRWTAEAKMTVELRDVPKGTFARITRRIS